MRCRSGDRCSREALDNERFCEPHLTQLRAIRAELEQETRDRAPQSTQRRAAARGDERKQREGTALA